MTRERFNRAGKAAFEVLAQLYFSQFKDKEVTELKGTGCIDTSRHHTS